MLKLWIHSMLIAGSLLASASAFAADARQANKPAAQDAAKTGVVIPNDEEAFLERLHHANQQEVKLGKLAQQKAVSPQVKEFAHHMVTAHTQADQDLMAYAKSKNMSLDEPKPMNEAEQKVMQANEAQAAELNALQGQAFDAAYLSAMVGDHDMVLGKLIAAEKQFKGAGSEQMIRKLIPEVRQHRMEAYRLLGTVTPKTSS